MKIQVVGYSSSGKSTFSKRLSKHYHIDVLHIDTIFLDRIGLKEIKNVEQEIKEFMTKDEWIIDGQYRKLATSRYEICDQLFLFDFNRFKCLYGAILRRIKYHKKVVILLLMDA